MLLGLIKSVILTKIKDTANSREGGRPWHSSRASDSRECHVPPSAEPALYVSSCVAHTRMCCGTAPRPAKTQNRTARLGLLFSTTIKCY